MDQSSKPSGKSKPPSKSSEVVELLKTLQSIADGVTGEARLPYLLILSALILLVVATWSATGWLKWTPVIVLIVVVAIGLVWAFVANRKRFNPPPQQLSPEDRQIIVRMHRVEKNSRGISSLIGASQAAVLRLLGKIFR
jgi:MFS superfamily sulfate permease-like transporter